jgi:hypothetical protein
MPFHDHPEDFRGRATVALVVLLGGEDETVVSDSKGPACRRGGGRWFACGRFGDLVHPLPKSDGEANLKKLTYREQYELSYWLVLHVMRLL